MFDNLDCRLLFVRYDFKFLKLIQLHLIYHYILKSYHLEILLGNFKSNTSKVTLLKNKANKVGYFLLDMIS